MTHVPKDLRSDRRLKVEKELRDLRNANRLAVHMNERQQTPYYSPETWGYFSIEPEEIAAKAHLPQIDKKWRVPMLSMSLLPSGGKTIVPYDCADTASMQNAYGYLVDVSQDKPYPPRVFGATSGNLGSLGDPHQKQFWGGTYNFLPRKLQRQYTGAEQWLEEFAVDAKAKELSSMLLNRLGSYYTGATDFPIPPLNTPVSVYNELLVAASKKHIRAIMLPVGGSLEEEENDMYRHRARLMAALSGLEHLANNIELPVVLYRMSDGPGVKGGDITYLGQGRQELLEVAVAALEALDGLNAVEYGVIPPRLAAATKRLLDVDPREPLAEQIKQMSALKRELNAGMVVKP